MEQTMENDEQQAGPSTMIVGTPMKRWRPETNPVDECRSLVRVLAGKIEHLRESGRSDQNKAICIRAMSTRLNALDALLNRLDQEPAAAPAMDVMEDALGFTYRSVRFCDLERISDK
jgi:hypothetical protein